ncbi:MAG TPA: serine/threonine-protein kinase [Kofleriaceae bacterium]|nr:serine/threonine-protein kinase [Kofleriaceae bacterium]
MVLPERIDALVGSTLGKDYRVLQVLGTGGMAVVYLVEHQTLLKRFAAKVLSSELASSAEARERFAQEAHAASQLDHENIVTISDFGITADQRPFFVMELLRGQTLDQRLGDGPMSIEEVVAVAVPVARALAHAHAEGIVHRDVKPENIFLVQRSQGRWGVKVVDFGIAKLPINPKRTSRNETLGSPLFMAPEMIRGEDDAVDQRADVYSFGVLLYLMLCRRLPFFDDNLRKVMQMHLASPVPPPRAVNPALPEPLAQVVERALAKRADDRYPSLDSLLIEFEAALPPGADRLLIEAQSGAAAHETPFAQTLAIARESPRITPSEPALRTMRVSPLPSPSAVLPVTPLRSPPPRRIGIVLTSALVTGLLGIVAYGKLAGRAHRPVTGGARGELVAARPVPVPAPAPAPGSEAPAPAPSPAATPPPGEPAAEPAAEPAPSEHPIVTSRRPVTRPKAPPRREPPRPGRRVAIAAAPGGPPRTAPAAPAAEPPPSPPPGEPAREPPAAPAEPAPGPGDSASAPAAVGPGSLDAMPVFEHLDVRGSLASSVVKRGMERQIGSLRACYQTAARAGNATPAVDLQVSLEIDENGAATHVSTSGTGFGPLARCAASVLGGVHTQQAPDTGTAQVSVMLRFRPS